ncbi:MAG: adenine deaminase [Lachnospiraceae bacterium]|jgi:adenine deaminase
MDKETLSRLLDTAMGRIPADVVIKNGKVIDVYQHQIVECDVAISGEYIAGLGSYSGKTEIDAAGAYIAPGFIDGHIHIESSHLSPEEFGRISVPCGTTTVIADPHEIANVCGLEGISYMQEAASYTALDVKFMIPSCVPSTTFENAGAALDAQAMEAPLQGENVLGLGEFMNYPGVVGKSEDSLDKLLLAHRTGKMIDGHGPGLADHSLNAYVAAGIHTDHECTDVEGMQACLSRGMYVLMREGSCCHDLRTLLKGVTPFNSRYCLLCSDDRQPKTISEKGHIDGHLRICVEEGIDPITAIQMGSLNAAQCYRLYDRGGIAPGLRADLVLFDDLQEFGVKKVWIKGKLVAEDGVYLLPVSHPDCSKVRSSFHVKNFSADRLRMPLASDLVHVIGIQSGIVTKKEKVRVKQNEEGEFCYDASLNVAKAAVIERHKGTGNVALGLLKGYGIQKGAIAVSIAHDSHNIIAVGTNDRDMECAVNELIRQEGGIVLALDGEILTALPMPIAGIMSDCDGRYVEEQLSVIHEKAHEVLGISRNVDPVMTLCFMALPVIPEIKLTDMGLFDVEKFSFIPLEAQEDEEQIQ